jgi:hypothetical protein
LGGNPLAGTNKKDKKMGHLFKEWIDMKYLSIELEEEWSCIKDMERLTFIEIGLNIYSNHRAISLNLMLFGLGMTINIGDLDYVPHGGE